MIKSFLHRLNMRLLSALKSLMKIGGRNVISVALYFIEEPILQVLLSAVFNKKYLIRSFDIIFLFAVSK
jgi:hypothetical protein